MNRSPKVTNSYVLKEMNGEADPEEIIRNSKTFNLPELDEKFLFRFVKSFVKSAEKEFLKPSERTFLESFAIACIGFSGCGLAIATPGSDNPGNVFKIAPKLAKSAASSIVDSKRIVELHHAQKNVKDFLIQDDKGNTDPAEVILRQFLAKISTDIFLRYIEQIRQWTSTHGYIYVDEIGNVFGQRCCYKLKKIDLQSPGRDTYDSIVGQFIGNDNIGKTMESWFLETTKFKVEDYRSIFHDPIPALWVKGQLKVMRTLNGNAAKNAVLVDGHHTRMSSDYEPLVPKWLAENDNIIFEQLRPPFNFEQRDMEAHEKDLLTVNVKTTLTHISMDKFIWEDSSALARKLCQKLEVDLNPFKKIRVEAEKHKDEMLSAQGKTQLAVDELLLIEKRRENLNKIKPKSTAANPVSYFTGREALLQEIHKKLEKCNLSRTGSGSGSVSTSNSPATATATGLGSSPNSRLSDKMVFLVGPEGYGKTETAKKYAETYLQEYYTNIIWIEAGSFESLKRSFEKTAREWGIDLHSHSTAKVVPVNNKSYDFDADQKRVSDLCQVVYQYFIDGGSEQNSLFIFDNALVMTDVGVGVGVGNTATRNGFGIEKFLPLQQGGFLPVFLVTSSNCNCNWGRSAHMENNVRIEQLPPCDTLSILNTRFDIQKEDLKCPEYKELEKSMTELGIILDGFPLALSIVASSILAGAEENY